MRYTTFDKVSSRTERIDMSSKRQDAPSSLTFVWSGHEATFSVETVQSLRRAVVREHTSLTDKGENKILFIKALRGITGLGLKESKDVAETFMEMFPLEFTGRVSYDGNERGFIDAQENYKSA